MNISGFCSQWQYFPVNFLTANFSIVSYSNALKCYSRARHYCTTAKHVINMLMSSFNTSPSSMLLIRVCAHHGSLPVSWSIQQKKHGIWITKKLIFSPRMSKQQIQWLNDHLIKNYNPWKVHVPNKALERSFLYQSYEKFFVCDYYEQGTEHCSVMQDI